MSADRLTVTALSKQFARRRDESLRVLDGIDLQAGAGEFVAIVGPSGSGKSTLFNIVAGLEQPSAGQVLIDGTPVAGTGDRVAYMPQKDLLFPWRTIEANTTLGLEIQGLTRREALERVRSLFDTFGLDGFQRSYPAQLSGGMRQRAALLRTVVMDRPLLLLDEPFGALDSLTRTDMQLWLASMWEQFHWTVVLVTHDVREAVFLADTVYVLSHRPAVIKTRVEVPIARPRDLHTYTTAEFAALERRVLDELQP